MRTSKYSDQEAEAIVSGLDLDLQLKAKIKTYLMTTETSDDGKRTLEARSEDTWRGFIEWREVIGDDSHGAREFADRGRRGEIVGRYLAWLPRIRIGSTPYEQPWSYGIEAAALRAFQRREEPFGSLPGWARGVDTSAPLADLLQRKRFQEGREAPPDWREERASRTPVRAEDLGGSVGEALGEIFGKPRPVGKPIELSGPSAPPADPGEREPSPEEIRAAIAKPPAERKREPREEVRENPEPPADELIF